MAASTRSRAASRTCSSAPVAAIRSQTASADAWSSERRSSPASSGSRSRAQDQRQRDRAVEQVGAAGLAGALRRAGDVKDVVEKLEGEADRAAEQRQRLVAGRVRAADRAGALEQTRGLQLAAKVIALDLERGVVGVAALGELAERERDRGPGDQLDLAVAGRPAPPPPRRVVSGDGPVPASSRTPARTAGRRAPSAVPPPRPRTPSAGRGEAAHRRGRRRGRASPCAPARSRWRRGSRPARTPGRRTAAPGSAAGACRRRQRGRGVGGEELAVAAHELGEAGLDLAHPRRQPCLGDLHHHRDGRRRRGAVHGARTPEWIAMIPPASSGQRMSLSPAASISAARRSGSGNERTDSGR